MGTTRIRSFNAAAMQDARKAKGWSRGRLGVALGISATAIAKWERGASTPEPPRMLDIAEALGMEPKALMTIPPKDWTLADFRVASGFHQADVTRGFGVTPTRLSSLELGYEQPRADEIKALAAAYATTPAKLRTGWRRTRARLLESD